MSGQADWRGQAACLGLDTNLFFPAVGDGTTVRQALAVCNGDLDHPPCPVREQCLEFIIGFDQDEDVAGIFGGMTSADRKKLRKQRRIELVSDVAVPGDRLNSGDLFTYQLGVLLNAIHYAVGQDLG